MKMRNLGKIFFTLLFLDFVTLHADVIANVDATEVEYGEIVTYNLVLGGEDVKKPQIDSLCGSDVIATGSSTSHNIVNGKYEKNYVLSYKFMPKKSCTIEAVEIEINGEKQKTEPIDIKVSKHVTSKNDNFVLELNASKSEVYVGEAFDVSLVFRQNRNIAVVDNKFARPDFQGFWIKGEPKQDVSRDGPFSTTTIVFKVAPQREGNLEIEPAQISIATRENKKNYWGGFFPDVQWRTYFSNDLNISVKPLPPGVDIVGDIRLEASTDKTEVNANEAVNVTVKVVGDANLEDIQSFKPYVQDVSVFDEKIEIKENVLSQRVTFVGERDFSVPSFTLKVFDPDTKEISTLTTKAIDIHVKNPVAKKKDGLVVKKETLDDEPVKKAEPTPVKEYDKFVLAIVFLSGVLVGAVLMFFKPRFSRKTKQPKLDIKDHKVLLVKLLPYKENKDVQGIVEVLENNLYAEQKQELDYKLLKEILKKYAIS